MKEQSEEMTKSVDEALIHNVSWNSNNGVIAYSAEGIARKLFDDGYRKQKEGEWEPRTDVIGFVRCSVCKDCNIYDEWADGKKWNFCPNCGAKMKGGAE